MPGNGEYYTNNIKLINYIVITIVKHNGITNNGCKIAIVTKLTMN